MIIFFKISAILSAGVLAGWLASILISRITKMLEAVKAKTASKPVDAPKQDRVNPVKKAVKTLAENPSSKESNKIKLIASLIPFLLLFLLSGSFLFGLLGGLGVFFGLGWYFTKKINDKMKMFNDQLIDALGVITNSVRAGQSLLQALENMVKDSKPPLSTEFEAVLQKIKLGMPVSEALLEMSQKIKSNDLRISVISINLARESGGNMGEILSRISETMRERKKIQGKITALTAQGKASGIVMGFVPFILLGVLYFIQPSIMGLLFSTLIGNIMLFAVVIMITVGMVVINKIVSIDI